VESSTSAQRIAVTLLGVFGGLALLLAAVGLYGVMSYSVLQRSHEIGIRMALGAEKIEVLTLVIKTGLRLVLLGIAFGLIVSLALGLVITSQLWGVSPYDPITLIGTAALLLLICVVACWLPARRATQVDPLIALRYE